LTASIVSRMCRSAAGEDATEVLKARMQRIATDRDTDGVA
jgi:hypothetical protein